MKKYRIILYFLVPYLCFLLVKYLYQDQDTYSSLSTAYNSEGYADMSAQEVPDIISFNFHVKPILSDKCFLCHGPDGGTREAGLRFDTEEGAFAALGELKDHYAIVPGKPDESKMVYRITNKDPNVRMPPPDSNLNLTEYEKSVLVKWIEQDAQWESHWSFIPPVKPEVPEVSNKYWPKNEIDHFIARKLESKGIKPSERASKEKLIRRLYFDLTGLPPSIEAIDKFLADTESKAYEKIVDDLLASEAYGERMSSDWLDIARYADSHGYQDDLERTMWPWRDWVIYAFNSNLPFDKFITWQLAGDLLDNPTKEQIIATGFNRNHKITQEGGVVDEEYRVEYVKDRTITTTKSLIGITMECSQCHDHKYDPISQKNFYQVYSFFNQVDEKGRIGYSEIPEPYIDLNSEIIKEEAPFIHKPDSIKEIKLMVMEETPGIRETYILDRGAYDAIGEVVDYGTPEAILSFDESFPKNRLGLAQWFLDEKNPLTARVSVNRYWQLIFGRGIVSTPADFGNQGALPSHPELLDWLAVTFREEGWDIKGLIKKMVMSETYQQSSKITKEGLNLDPENSLLSRGSRYKLPAEMIRDNALSISGLLVHKTGGPSVKPYQPKGLWKEKTGGGGGSLASYVLGKGEQLYRRSLYTFWKRTAPPPSMMTFDTASRDFCEVKRQKTSTPLQALILLNDPQYIESARVLATNLLKKEFDSEEDKSKMLFRIITSRYPDEEELENMTTYLEESNEGLIDSDKNPEDLLNIGETPLDKSVNLEELYKYTNLACVLLNLEETIIKS
jgi:hypothetical protein